MAVNQAPVSLVVADLLGCMTSKSVTGSGLELR